MEIVVIEEQSVVFLSIELKYGIFFLFLLLIIVVKVVKVVVAFWRRGSIPPSRSVKVPVFVLRPGPPPPPTTTIRRSVLTTSYAPPQS